LKEEKTEGRPSTWKYFNTIRRILEKIEYIKSTQDAVTGMYIVFPSVKFY